MWTTHTILAIASLLAITAPIACGTEIEFCRWSNYAPGDVCPDAQPSTGGGTCYNMTVQAGTCYTFDDFPSAPGDLIGNVGYIYVPGGDVSSCALYGYVDALDGQGDDTYMTPATL